MLHTIGRFAWITSKVLVGLFAVLLGLPADQLAIGLGWTMIQWLQYPPILVPIVSLATLFVAWDLIWWWNRRRIAAAQKPTPDMSVRDFFTYLRTHAAIAYQFDDYRVWMNEVERRVRDDLADADGSLVSWGRAQRYRGNYDDLLPFEKLHPSYWLTHELDMQSALSANYHLAHTNVVLNKTEPRFDLHVSRKQVSARFPEAPFLRRLLFTPKIGDGSTPTRIERNADGTETHIWESLDGKSRAEIIRAAKSTPQGNEA